MSTESSPQHDLSDLEALPVAQVAPLLHCTPRTVYNLIASGRLRAIRLCGERRVPVTALRAYLAGDPTPTTVTPMRATRQRRAG